MANTPLGIEPPPSLDGEDGYAELRQSFAEQSRARQSLDWLKNRTILILGGKHSILLPLIRHSQLLSWSQTLLIEMLWVIWPI